MARGRNHDHALRWSLLILRRSERYHHRIRLEVTSRAKRYRSTRKGGPKPSFSFFNSTLHKIYYRDYKAELTGLWLRRHLESETPHSFAENSRSQTHTPTTRTDSFVSYTQFRAHTNLLTSPTMSSKSRLSKRARTTNLNDTGRSGISLSVATIDMNQSFGKRS